MRTISNPWLGVSLGGLAAAYLCVASVIPDRLAGLLGAPGGNIFRHWLIVGMAGAAMLNMLLASILHVRRDLPRLGAWLAHGGAMVLAVGAGWFAMDARHGQAVSVKVPRANFWTAMDSFYLPDRFACYVRASIPGGGQTQTPLPIADLQKIRTLDAPLAGLPDGLSAKAVEYLPDATLTDYVLLELAQGEKRRRVELTAVNPQHQADGFYIIYHPDISENALQELIGKNSPSGFSTDVLLVITRRDSPALAVVVDPEGKSRSFDLNICRPVDLTVAGGAVRLEMLTGGLKAIAEHPPAAGERGICGPALLVECRGTDSAGKEWRSRQAVPFSQFQHISLPATIGLPRGGTVELGFAQASLPLPRQISICATTFITHPGSEVPADYICHLNIDRGENVRKEVLQLNRPVMVGQYQISQGAWLDDPRRPRMIVLEVSSRPGLWLVWLGMAILALGLVWSILIKPLLPGHQAGEP
ncbi:MAG: hypothetical protein HZA50_18905 [Planctomycetes bacterium]|nr:hypothetical protein [Planctomycetota bacterium]